MRNARHRRNLARPPQRGHDRSEVIPLIYPDEAKPDKPLNNAARGTST
jgi:hypothetical protein